MANSMTLPRMTKKPLAWILTLFLAVLAWIATLQQTFSMSSIPMYGAMGMSLVPFLFFWLLMMAAMMLPGLAPIVSVRYAGVYRYASNNKLAVAHCAAFILGYLCLWLIGGIPIFFLATLNEQLIFHAPIVAIALGVFLFIATGLYQMTPLKRRCLAHCNPFSAQQAACAESTSPFNPLSAIKDGLWHGLFCVGCCGNLMLILLAVGLMNLPWMLMVTGVIFLEKTWSRGSNLSFSLGILLIFYGLCAFISPTLLPGLYSGHF